VEDHPLFSSRRAAPPPPASQDLLEKHLPDLHRAIRSLARHHRLADDEERDLLGDVLVRLLADDYAVLRKYRGESGIATYLRRVAYRVLLDTRIRRWGKWRPSTRARTLGAAAVRFERMVARDGLTPAEALATMDGEPDLVLDPELAQALAAAIGRRRRRREVPLAWAAGVAVEASQHRALESRRLSRHAAEVGEAMRRALRSLSAEDRQLLHERFVQGRSVATLARRARADQKCLYRRFTRILGRLRRELAHARIGHDDVRPLIGHPEIEVAGVLAPAS
jgi:RNA polymerase sigma factor (sigma-70 family)